MSAIWRQSATVLALFLALASWNCDSRGHLAEGPTGPQSALVETDTGEEYELIEGRIPSEIEDLQVSALIGIDGGQISLAGHKLTVPAGAVAQPTLFTMTLVTDGRVEVDLSATITDALGQVIDIGEQGFQQPVTLTMTYAWASNVSDPAQLLILWMKDGGSVEPQPSTVSATGKTVSTVLWHFSRYCMASG